MHEAYCIEIDKYKKELAEGKHWDTLDENHNWMHNLILERLYSAGCGISQNQDEMHAIRNDIQKYLEGYNPIKRPLKRQ